MRILYVTPFFAPICGGVEAVLDTTTKALVEKGHEVQLLTSSLPGVPEVENQAGLKLLRTRELDVPESGIVDPASFDYREKARFMRGIAEEFNPHVIHFHNYQMRQYGMFLQSFLSGVSSMGIPTINTIHNDADDLFVQYLLSYSPLDCVVTVTRKSAIQLMEGGVPEQRLRYVPNMVDSDRYRTANRHKVRRLIGIDEDIPLILFPSRIVGREGNMLLDSTNGKGLQVLLESLPEVFESLPSARILLLGNDPIFQDKVTSCKRRLKAIADKIGAGDKLLFFNQFVPNSMLPEIFAASDLVVSLSQRETFGMVFIEGMAAGKPVVGVNSSYGGVSEVVPDNIAGILVPPNDAHSTAKAITRILKNDGLRESMGANGVSWVKEHYDTSVVIPMLEATYEGLRSFQLRSERYLSQISRRVANTFSNDSPIE
jgi:glycosyltransferase involved in cell wall biosynthesis